MSAPLLVLLLKGGNTGYPTVVTPPERTLAVSAENRVMAIEEDDCVMAIEEDD